MKKCLVGLFLLFLTINIYAYVNAAGMAAVGSSAAAASRRDEMEHERKFHNGPMECDIEQVNFAKKNKEFKYIIETYERRYYYYAFDPKKCCIKYETIGPIATRQATEEEAKIIDRSSSSLIIALIGIILAAGIPLFMAAFEGKIDEYRHKKSVRK